jgi:regulator of protease activity HflC (stomatin/prohibitin superfamily)
MDFITMYGFYAILFAIGLITVLTFLSNMVYLVRQAEAIIIERLGRYDRTMGPGLHIVVPFIESPRGAFWSHLIAYGDDGYQRLTQHVTRIDLRESVYDFPKQNVITKDNVTMEISALLYYQITDPKAAIYEVSNLPEAIEKLTQTTLRNVIGAMDLDQTLVSRDYINEKLRHILDEASDKWGVKVNRVELQEVNPPADIRHAMEKQMRAERDRRALILEAEGFKAAAILKAEGVLESDVLQAKGQAQARIITAESEASARTTIAHAEAEAIGKVKSAIPNGDPMPYLIAQQYLKMLPEMMAGKNDKLVVVPYEATAMAGSLATMKKIFENIKD